MKYGIREICDVVLKAKARMKIGDKVFYKDEPVIYFDTLKTSTMEGAATTVYAQGGRGNSRLIAWEGERTVTFTMEDALISTEGLAILTGANVIAGSTTKALHVHTTEKVKMKAPKEGSTTKGIYVTEKPYIGATGENWIYVMTVDSEGNVNSEPYLYTCTATQTTELSDGTKGYELTLKSGNYSATTAPTDGVVMVDYYVEKHTGQQIEITPDTFGGNFYLEASTLFRDTNGTDLPAEFIIPNCKIQSNFTFNMASSGDPSTFTFTMDAFPDYTRFDATKKVLSVIQVIGGSDEDKYQRVATVAGTTYNTTDNVTNA
jgi:hypothetical protein